MRRQPPLDQQELGREQLAAACEALHATHAGRPLTRRQQVIYVSLRTRTARNKNAPPLERLIPAAKDGNYTAVPLKRRWPMVPLELLHAADRIHAGGNVQAPDSSADLAVTIDRLLRNPDELKTAIRNLDQTMDGPQATRRYVVDYDAVYEEARSYNMELSGAVRRLQRWIKKGYLLTGK